MKTNKLLLVLILFGLMLCGCETEKVNYPNETETVSDYVKFKNEYEGLNSTVREGTEQVYSDITIPEFEDIRYVDPAETLKIIEDENAVIYIGANWCPWCRQSIAPFLNVCKEKGVSTIYYLNLDNYKSRWEKSGDTVKMIKEGTSDYYDLLEKLDDYLEDYTLDEIATGEKRIYQPTFLTVAGGRIVQCEIITHTLNEGQTAYDNITEEQTAMLTERFTSLINAFNTAKELCGTDGPCD